MKSARDKADDAQQLREEIEHNREALGASVEQLAARTDVKGRARAQAAAVTGRMKVAAAKAREQAVTGTRIVSNGASIARKHWAPLSATAGVVLAIAALTIWQQRRLRSSCRINRRAYWAR